MARGHPALTEFTLDGVAAFEGCVQTVDGIGHGGPPDQTALNIRERAGRRKQKWLQPRSDDDHPVRQPGHPYPAGQRVNA